MSLTAQGLSGPEFTLDLEVIAAYTGVPMTAPADDRTQRFENEPEGGPTGHHRPPAALSHLARTVFHLADTLSGGLIILTMVLSPWAFGGTTPLGIQLINMAGWLLGLLLMIKLAASRFRRRASGTSPSEPPSRRWLNRMLIGATMAIPLYCLVSLLNARATFNPTTYEFAYHSFIAWLPGSFDRDATLESLATTSSLALTFWAARHWLKAGTERSTRSRRRDGETTDGDAPSDDARLPERLRLLVWILAIHCGLLALEGLVQRTSGTSKLLWLVEPRINKAAAAQFGPYAYRSNAAAYFLLAWPLILGLWWNLHHSARSSPKRSAARYTNYLVPCLFLTAGVPILSLSRAGLIIGSLSILAALAILIMVRRGSSPQVRQLISAALAGAFCLALAIEWLGLRSRLEHDSPDSGRMAIWASTWKIVQDYPVFGAGPGSFSSVYSLYRDRGDDYWFAQAHNDWLETLANYGMLGCLPFLLAMTIIAVLPLTRGGLPANRMFTALVWVATGSCLLFALLDFPLQIASIQYLFVVEGAILSVLSFGKR